MRAIVYSRNGDSSVLSIADRDPRTPGDREVRVKVAVSGVNPTDWKTRAGANAPMQIDEAVPNLDGAGIVDAVGGGVVDLRVGDRVWVYLAEGAVGTAQEYTTLPASRVIRLPDSTGFDIGASLGVPALTAHRALTVHEHGPARLSSGALDGRVVLVAGGAGAVGHAAIQLARWAGATLITTVSNDTKAGLARAAGAHHVLRYTDDDIAEQILAIAPAGVDQVVEVSPRSNAGLDVAVLANNGCIAYYANDGGGDFTVPIGASLEKNVRWQGLLMYNVGDDARIAAAEDITAALEAGALPVGEKSGLPLTWFSLEQTGAAHDAVEQGTTGKVLIRVTDAE